MCSISAANPSQQRKRRGVNQQSSELAIGLDERIDCLRNRLEILGCESIPRLYHQHTGVP